MLTKNLRGNYLKPITTQGCRISVKGFRYIYSSTYTTFRAAITLSQPITVPSSSRYSLNVSPNLSFYRSGITDFIVYIPFLVPGVAHFNLTSVFPILSVFPSLFPFQSSPLTFSLIHTPPKAPALLKVIIRSAVVMGTTSPLPVNRSSRIGGRG